MKYEVRYSDTFKKAFKALSKKYPSLKKDLLGLTTLLADSPDMGTPVGKICLKSV